MRLHVPRSLVAGALAASLVTLPVFAPSVAAAPPAPASCGSLGPPACDLLVTVKAALAPLEPLFAMGGPITDALGATVHGVQATIEQLVGDPEAVNAQDLAQQIGDLLDQLAVVPEPAFTTLSLLGLGGLRSALADLQAALAAQAGATESAVPVTASSGAGAVPGPVGVPQHAAANATAVPVGPVVPVVPEGLVLDLPALGLPVFGAPADRPDRSAATAAAGAKRPIDLDAVLRNGDGTGAVAAAVALSGVLLSTGLLAHRSRRRTGSAEVVAPVPVLP